MWRCLVARLAVCRCVFLSCVALSRASGGPSVRGCAGPRRFCRRARCAMPHTSTRVALLLAALYSLSQKLDNGFLRPLGAVATLLLLGPWGSIFLDDPAVPTSAVVALQQCH